MPMFLKAESTEFIFAAQGEDKKPSINIVAYNGGMLRLGNFSVPVVLEMKGVKASNRVPFLIDHQNSTDAILGQGTLQKTDSAILASGTVTGASARAKEILETSKNGHVYQASVGAIPHKSTFVEEGVKAKINGREFTGPLVHVTASEIIEVSIVAIGADREGTEVEIAAMFGLDEVQPKLGNVNARKEENMDPKLVKWVQAHLGLDEDTLKAMSPEQLSKIEAHYKEATKAPVAPVKEDDEVKASIAAMQEELRVTKITAACGSDFSDLAEKAIEAGWDLSQVEASLSEIQKIRDARPSAPGVIIGGEKSDGKTLEAAVACNFTSLDSKTLEASYGEETLNKAEPMRHLTVKDIMQAACRIEGVNVPSIGSSPEQWAQAAFSTRTFPTLLSNVANKVMWESYNRRESVAVRVSKKLSANDFKTHTKARVLAGGGMELIENGGEIKHQTMEDESYTYSIGTYGQLLGLTRQDIINDDLGAFTDIPNQMGFDAWQKREDTFFTTVNGAQTSGFFAAGNSNLKTGTGSALGLAGLQDAVTALEKMVDGKDRAISIQPELLMVPTELKVTAENFFNSANLITGADATITEKNWYQGKYTPLSSPFLSNTSITGYSTTAWYLMADPRVVAAFGIAYLNGREGPIIEEVGVDPRYLGRMFRAYMDFGVCEIDPKGAIKSTGVA